MTIGIDNGISGAITAIDGCGRLLTWKPMPIQRARRGNEVDVVGVETIIRTMTSGDPKSAVYVLEEPGGSKSVKAAVSMSASFHAIRAVLDMHGCRWHRVTPQRWQKAMLPGSKAGESKPRALELARRLWPVERWLATERCRTPHDGAIDAAIMAEWLRVHVIGANYQSTTTNLPVSISEDASVSISGDEPEYAPRTCSANKGES
jgi:hypothetical protein